MRIKRIITSVVCGIAGALLIAGCSKEISDTPYRNDGKVRVSFTTPIVEESEATREALAEKTTVRVVAYVAGSMDYKADQTYFMDSNGKLKPCTVNNDGSFKEVDMSNELALFPGTYDFYAYTPALPIVNKNSVTVPNGVDYASSVTSGIKVTTDQNLSLTTLARKCSKIKLVVKADPANTLMTKLEVAANGVTINNLPGIPTIGLNKPITQASGSETHNVPNSAFIAANATESSVITYLLPRLGENRMKIDYNLTYTVSGASETQTISGTMGNTVLQEGKSYIFTLTMRQAGASLEVTEWIENSQEVVSGKEFDYTDNGSPWFLIAAADAKNPIDGSTTMNWYVANGVYDATLNPNKLKACPDGWRVPGHKELMLLWTYKDTNWGYGSTNYWTADASSTDKAIFTSMTLGVTGESDKYTQTYVRCIRDNSNTKYPYVAKDGFTIVTRDEMGGVPENALMTSVQKEWLNNTNTSTTPYNELSVYNKAPSQLKVAKTDIALKTWSDAYKACKYEYFETDAPVGSWRLPTQRELMLIYTLNEKLLAPLDAVTTYSYWAGPENSSDNQFACYLIFSKGICGVRTAKMSTQFSRCVRDVGFVSQPNITADYVQWGNSFTTNVPFSSIEGAVTIQSIDNTGTDKNWLTSATVSGTTSGNVVITYVPTAGNLGVHSDVTIKLANRGGSVQNITVKYDNGFIPNSVLSANGWTTNLPGKGLQIAKKGNKLPSSTAEASPANSELVIWGPDQSISGAQQSAVGTGQSNTTAIGSSSAAVNKCTALGTGWYWSSLDELATIQKVHANYLGDSYKFEGSAYWASTEYSATTSSAWMIHMTTGTQSQGEKNKQSRIRCIRNVQ